MRPWIGDGTPVWPAGYTEWQVYLLPDLIAQRDLAGLIGRTDPVVRSPRWCRVLAPVPRRWLHLTVQPLPGPATEWSQQRVEELLTALRVELAGFAPVTAMIGPPLCGSSGVLLDVNVDGAAGERWADLHRRIRAAAIAVLPSSRFPAPSWPPHIALAYCRSRNDSGPVSSALRRIRPAHATAQFGAAWLVQVTQDPQRHQYRWERAYEISLIAERERPRTAERSA